MTVGPEGRLQNPFEDYKRSGSLAELCSDFYPNLPYPASPYHMLPYHLPCGVLQPLQWL